MSRKDYELLARALRDTRPQARHVNDKGLQLANTVANAVVDDLAYRLGAELMARNAAFDPKRWLEASGVANPDPERIAELARAMWAQALDAWPIRPSVLGASALRKAADRALEATPEGYRA